MAGVFLSTIDLAALGVMVPPQMLTKGPVGEGIWMEDTSPAYAALLAQGEARAKMFTKPAHAPAGAVQPAAAPLPEAKYEGRSCSLCQRAKPSPWNHEAPRCRQPGDAGCRQYAAGREERLRKAAGRIRGSYW